VIQIERWNKGIKRGSIEDKSTWPRTEPWETLHKEVYNEEIGYDGKHSDTSFIRSRI